MLAQYDALPGIGHACGHNVIAAAACGAALAVAPVADDLGLSVVVPGTPAEESLRQGGGRTLLLERGAFEGIDAAMMVHPTPFEAATPPLIAASPVSVPVTGKAAHAAAAPHHGRNAAAALTVAQVALGLLRQHLPPDTRVSGITTHAGEAANVIPALATADYMLPAPTLPELEYCTSSPRSGSGNAHWPGTGIWAYTTRNCTDIDLKVGATRRVRTCFKATGAGRWRTARAGQWALAAIGVRDGSGFCIQFKGTVRGTGWIAY